LGGRDKEGDFATLIPLLRSRARATILFGEAAEKINGLLGRAVETVLAATLKEAMQKAVALACPGDIVLLSPGCASFDEFCDYKHRGRVFRELVEELES
jgi:UDP-N-acetylmuramoylalanine--D-glutamate ligase